jgi:CHAT domain-containing protein
VADPVYTSDDARLRQPLVTVTPPIAHFSSFDATRDANGASTLTRLTSTGLEAAQIRALFAPQDADVLEGVEATRDNFLSKNLASYRFIHIASHGIIDSEIPQLSALVLSKYGTHGAVDDPYIRVGDLLARTFNAQVIVLSACDTALGKGYANEGFIGLRYAALARGARTVVASLWPVSDGISAELMTDMYRELMERTGSQRGELSSREIANSVSTSLSVAIRRLLAATPTLDPALWAPFAVYVAGDREISEFGVEGSGSVKQRRM